MIKPHKNRTQWWPHGGRRQVPKCAGCGKGIEYGSLAYYCLTRPTQPKIQLRKNQSCGKVCVKCGDEIQIKG